MDLRVLRYFLAVAREESITGAAEYLHLSQPTLSRQLMDLEAEFGKPLFIRGSRKITLTEHGTLLRKRASEILELVEKTAGELTATEEAVAGDIYIGGGESNALRQLAAPARRFRTDNPNVQFDLFSGNSADVSDRLDKGLLDFGILMGPRDLRKYDHMRLPAVDVWGVLMPGGHPLSEKETVRPEDLWDVPLLVSQQMMQTNRFAQWFRRDYESLNIAATYNLIFNASLMVEAGLGCALAYEGLVNTAERELCFRPVSPRMEDELYLVWKKFQVFSKASERFLAAVRQDYERNEPGMKGREHL